MKNYQKAGYPFLAVNTTEDERLIREQRRAIEDPDVKFWKWDVAAGFQAFVNPNGDPNVWMWQPAPAEEINDPLEALEFVKAIPVKTDADGNIIGGSIIFMLDFQKPFESVMITRTALNLKDHLKSSGKMIVFVSAVMEIPPEMANDVQTYDFKLPDKAAHKLTLERLCADTGLDMPEDAEAVVDACAGLTQEAAENALAKSLVDNGRFVYTDVLEKKAQQIKETGYLKFGTYTESFDDLYGLEYLKLWTTRALMNRNPLASPKGILIYGVPGSGKSHFSKALGNKMGRPVLDMSFSALRGGLVGDTERNTADCWKKIEAFDNAVVFADEFDKSLEGIEGSQTDGGNSARIFQSWMTYQEDRQSETFWVCTCNNLDTILSWSGGALAARFDCIFFVDMPTPDECKGIAQIWAKKMGIDIPEDYDFDGFTGRDIKKLSRQMAMQDCSVDEARRYVISIMESSSDLIQEIRKKARKTCIWASKEQETMSVKRRVKL